MKFSLALALCLALVNIFVDYVIYRIINRSRSSSRVLKSKIYLWFTAILYLVVCVVICMPKRNGSNAMLASTMWAFFAYLSIYIPKYIYLLFWTLSRWHPLRNFSLVGLIIAVFSFVLMWWGALFNRYNIQCNEVDIEIAALPESFDGLSIAQISDLHVGSFGTDTAFVSKLVDCINSLHPDVIVFTGDIVNRRSDELDAFVKPLSRLKAPMGVFSIMGNHDYGDYCDWPSPQAKADDISRLKSMEGNIGFTMLNDSTYWLRRGCDSIALIGVENIGKPPFHVYGSLTKAYPDIFDNNVKILLSHDPNHWEYDIQDHDSNIALTLSGHTHAMQIELFGISPSALKYDKWGGLYTDNRGQNLYVNIGAGEVGVPFRIGATPEITLFTLKPKVNQQ